MVFTALATGSLAFLTTGFWGTVLFWILTKIFAFGASLGLVMVNVGIAEAETLNEMKDFDGTFDEAFKLINGRPNSKLTPEEGNAIDNKVIAVFRKFAVFGKLSKPAG